MYAFKDTGIFLSAAAALTDNSVGVSKDELINKRLRRRLSIPNKLRNKAILYYSVRSKSALDNYTTYYEMIHDVATIESPSDLVASLKQIADVCLNMSKEVFVDVVTFPPLNKQKSTGAKVDVYEVTQVNKNAIWPLIEKTLLRPYGFLHPRQKLKTVRARQLTCA